MSAPCKNWGTGDPVHGMGLTFGWELTRAGAIIHLDVITSLVGSPVILSFEHFLSQTPWELLIKCIKKSNYFANYTITPHPEITSTNAAKSVFHKHLPHSGCLCSVNVTDCAKHGAVEKEDN